MACPSPFRPELFCGRRPEQFGEGLVVARLDLAADRKAMVLAMAAAAVNEPF